MVNVPTGGRKKKLKHNTATTDAVVASASPHVATSRIAMKYVSATVVGLTCRTTQYSAVITRTAPVATANRPMANR